MILCISFMKFRALVLELHLPQNFCHTHTDTLTHRHMDRQTDRHFPEIVKSCSGHHKTCKSIKNRKSKICPKPILFSIYIEESKKKKKNTISKVMCDSNAIDSLWLIATDSQLLLILKKFCYSKFNCYKKLIKCKCNYAKLFNNIIKIYR